MTDDDMILIAHPAPGVRELTLNRPKSFNALSSAMMTRLSAVLEEAAEDPAVRAIIVTGAGGRFCAGHDLKEVRGMNDPADRRALMAQCCALMTAITRHPKPIIAKVRGIATAAGCQLVASCDLAVAEDGARFSTPGVNIGLFCSTPMVALGRNVSRKHAMEMLLTGEMMTADEAARFGLINRVAPEEGLDDAALSFAAAIAAKSAYTVKIGKEAFYRQQEMDLDAAYAYAAEVMVENLAAADAAEGIGAFVEKRPPVWKDR